MRLMILATLFVVVVTNNSVSAADAFIHPKFSWILVVEGSDRSETINISIEYRRNFTVFYVVQTVDSSGEFFDAEFPASQVEYLQVFANGGDDRVENDTSLRSSLWGGEGEDALIGGSDNDWISGGIGGSDLLVGREGEDFLMAGSGSSFFEWDLLDGGPGLDSYSYGYWDHVIDPMQQDDDVDWWGSPSELIPGIPAPDYYFYGTYHLDELNHTNQ